VVTGRALDSLRSATTFYRSAGTCRSDWLDAPRLTLTRVAIEPTAVIECSGSNLDDRLPRPSLGRVEGRDGIIE
jgi:hypothetical protein